MKAIKGLGTALFFMLLAVAVSAGEGSWVYCNSSRPGPKRISPGTLACYEMDAANYADMTKTFTVDHEALICLNPDVDTEGADDVEVMPRHCVAGLANNATAPNVNECLAILDASLDGTTGGARTQNACIRVGQGIYYLDVTAPTGAEDVAVVSVRGE
jgi:hypothetical protein